MIAVSFEPRTTALEPSCVVGEGAVARLLAERVLSWDDGALAWLRGVAFGETLVLLGASDRLPWVDGVAYLGVDPAAPKLLLPTQLRPSAPVDVFERAVVGRAAHLAVPIAVLSRARRLVSVAHARPLERSLLQAWAGASP